MQHQQNALTGFDTAVSSWQSASATTYGRQVVYVRQAAFIASNSVILLFFGVLVALQKSVDPGALRFVLFVGVAYCVLWGFVYFGGLRTEKRFRNIARECARRELVVDPAGLTAPESKRQSIIPCVALGLTIASFFAAYIALFFLLPLIV